MNSCMDRPVRRFSSAIRAFVRLRRSLPPFSESAWQPIECGSARRHRSSLVPSLDTSQPPVPSLLRSSFLDLHKRPNSYVQNLAGAAEFKLERLLARLTVLLAWLSRAPNAGRASPIPKRPLRQILSVGPKVTRILRPNYLL
jgi:hypothetical protein